jgi:spore germination cell wall hydrolase CwlJ-like protein
MKFISNALSLFIIVALVIICMQGKPKQHASMDLSERDLYCLVQNIYHEARGEPDRGKIWVAYVTLNRVGAPGYRDTVCDVVWQKGYKDGKWIAHFSWTLDGKSDAMLEQDSIAKAVDIALATSRRTIPDPTGKCLNYFNPRYRKPSWSENAKVCGRRGGHACVEVARR